MAGVNKVILIGNLGNDPEVRYTQEGKAIANITLATSEAWKDKNTGQKQEKTEWHRVAFFGGVADVVANYLKKGSKVYVEGKLQTRKWQDQAGQDRYTTEVIVDGFSGAMQMLDSANVAPQAPQAQAQQYTQAPQQQRQAPQQQYAPQQAPQQQAQQQQAQQQAPADDFEDQIPF